ncbi:hypothetical protein [Bacillus sp. MUM 13]|uniref:hypothetical protein n=1 Tax=Bacillus sp. MUM 13 TaxID=1678001 RepID=UPI0008F5B80D|nr:hypothetical protein [Bacillus sp. MUM 13]OIK08906.1 hypothetical protein BIV59_18480 [Bacillus sp. MUM 13]
MNINPSQWNKENDAAINSPGDIDHSSISKNLLSVTAFEMSQSKNDTPEYDIYGTVLNDL